MLENAWINMRSMRWLVGEQTVALNVLVRQLDGASISLFLKGLSLPKYHFISINALLFLPSLWKTSYIYSQESCSWLLHPLQSSSSSLCTWPVFHAIFRCCFIDKDNLEFPVFVTYSSGCFLLLLYPSGMHSSFAGKVSIQVIPQMLSLAINFPTQKFLQAQSKVAYAVGWC